jgi:hypothetical protein
LPTKVDGRGTINSQSDRVTFHLGASQSDDNTSADYFSFCDPAACVCLTNVRIRNLSIKGNTSEFNGRAQLAVRGQCD